MNSVYHHTGANRDQQDIAGHPDVALARHRRRKLNDDRWRNFVVNDALRKGPSDLPLFRLAWWHAAVVLLCKTRVGSTPLKFFVVILAHYNVVAIIEVSAMLPSFFVAIISRRVVFLLLCGVYLFCRLPRWVVPQTQAQMILGRQQEKWQ